MRSVWCMLGFHKWGFEHWGIQICERLDCGKVDMHRGAWGSMRLNSEKEAHKILTTDVARKHWVDLERWRITW